MHRDGRLNIAEWHAFESLRLQAAGNAGESREHIADACEQLQNAGVNTAEIESALDVFTAVAYARTETVQ